MKAPMTQKPHRLLLWTTNLPKRLKTLSRRLGANNFRAISALIIISLVALLAIISSQQSHLGKNTKDYYEAVTTEEIRDAHTRFTIGMFLQKISAFDPQTKTFAADGYAWIKWKKPVKAWDQETQADPALTLEFINAVEHWDFIKKLSPEAPYTDSEGWTYQSIIFSGRFLANEINLRRFPFESITLPIEIESDDFWLT